MRPSCTWRRLRSSRPTTRSGLAFAASARTRPWERGDLEAARRLAEEACALAEAHGDANDLAPAHEALAVVVHLRGEWREGLKLELERLAAAGDESEQLALVFDIAR